MAQQIYPKLQFNWSSELYGLGKSIRKVIRYPKWMPLFFSSDHGVTISEDIPDVFRASKKIGRYYLSWNPHNVALGTLENGLKIIGVKHPWVSYRQKMGYKKARDAKGTIFFPFHHAPGYTFQGHSDNEAIEKLKLLPLKYQPICVSLHHHDVGTNRQKLYEESGFETVSAGNGRFPEFVDNFYKMVTPFAHGIVQGVGSPLFYLTELGIPTQVFSIKPIVIENQSGINVITAETYEAIEFIGNHFKDEPELIQEEQIAIIEKYLGFEYADISKYRKLILSMILINGFPWLLRETSRMIKSNLCLISKKVLRKSQ